MNYSSGREQVQRLATRRALPFFAAFLPTFLAAPSGGAARAQDATQPSQPELIAQVDSEPHPAPLEEIVAELTDRVTALEDENRWLRAADCRPCPPLTAANAVGGRAPIRWRGRIHADLWKYPGDSPGVNAFESGSVDISPQDRLELRRARLATIGELPGGIEYKLDFELSEASNPEFRDLYIGWKDLPILHRVLFGNQKRPYGLDHLNSSNFNVFLERPFAVQAFNRNNRRFGLVSYGLAEDENWNWRYGVFNLTEIQRDGLYNSDHWQLEMAARLARTIGDPDLPSRYVHLAVSTGLAFPDGVPAPGRAPSEARFRTEPEARTENEWLDTRIIDGTSEFHVLGLEGVVNVGRWQLAGEYLNTWVNRDVAFGDDLHLHGGYIYLSCFLTEHFQPWNRAQGIIDRVQSLRTGPNFRCDTCGAWQIGVRWSFVDLTDSNIAGGVGESITATLSWYWTPRARLQINAAYGDISQHRPEDGQTFGHYVAIGTRALVDF